jgi:hypothetical protein
MSKLIPIATTMTVVDMTTGKAEEKPATMHLLPAAPDKCPECAVDHEPWQAHNKDSLFYQMQFYGRHRRWPVWADAVAHCAPEIAAVWEAELRKGGHWKEPSPPDEPKVQTTPVPADALLQPGQEIEIIDPKNGSIRPARVTAVVPKGVPFEHAIADQNGQLRSGSYTLNRRRSTIYIVDRTEADGHVRRLYVPHKHLAQGLKDAVARPKAEAAP